MLWESKHPRALQDAVVSEVLAPSHVPTQSKLECKQRLSLWAAPCLHKSGLLLGSPFVSKDEVREGANTNIYWPDTVVYGWEWTVLVNACGYPFQWPKSALNQSIKGVYSPVCVWGLKDTQQGFLPCVWSCNALGTESSVLILDGATEIWELSFISFKRAGWNGWAGPHRGSEAPLGPSCSLPFSTSPWGPRTSAPKLCTWSNCCGTPK